MVEGLRRRNPREGRPGLGHRASCWPSRPDVTMGGGAETFAQTATGGDYQRQDAGGAGQGARLPDRPHRRRIDQRQQGRSGRPAARAVRRRQHAGAAGPDPPAVRQGYLQPAAKCTDNPEHGFGRTEIGRHDAEGDRPARRAHRRRAEPGQGLLLQVESASIDKRDHAADACGQIGETVVFDEAVKKAIDFAKKDGNTLVIATADHGHTSQIVEPVTEDDLRSVADETKLPIERVRDHHVSGPDGEADHRRQRRHDGQLRHIGRRQRRGPDAHRHAGAHRGVRSRVRPMSSA